MKDKRKSAEEAVASVKSGSTIMVGGFLANGTPEILIDALIESGVDELTVICNDGGYPARGVGKLIALKRVKKLIASHVGLNPDVAEQMNEGTLEVELIPQGTLAERISAAGKGIGGFYTPTGVGTMVAKNKEMRNINGKKYLLELPLYADFALIRGSVTDMQGNMVYNKSTRNFNPIMATAAKHVIAATEKLVETGELIPEHIVTPGVYVDVIVEGEAKCQM